MKEHFDIRLIGLSSALNGIKVKLLIDNSSLNHYKKELWINKIIEVLGKFNNFDIASKNEILLKDNINNLISLRKCEFKESIVVFIDKIREDIDNIVASYDKEQKKILGNYTDNKLNETIFKVQFKEIINVLMDNFKLEELEDLKESGYTPDVISELIESDFKDGIENYIFNFIKDLI
ncbi:hypothetical protein [Clostridium thermobutyricum]|uniref:hypothetical protein n=1 Tax=Clostridium thermobutyricum TaxID=29372 RepID=UPI0018AC07F6|nr:hypothetical protein [Clostridium thermobutyricum]